MNKRSGDGAKALVQSQGQEVSRSGGLASQVTPPGRPIAGDVIGARRAAVDLLQGPSSADPGLAVQRLVLTAVCLHVDIQGPEGASPRAVVAYLHRILTDAIVDPALARSPMQFVRYAASELGAMTADERSRMVCQLIALIDPPAPSSGSSAVNHKNI